MSTLYHQTLEVLRRYLSELHAVGTLDRTLREAGLDADRFSFADIPRTQPSLERRTRLFVDPELHARLSAELTQVCPDPPSSRARYVSVQKESDISIARLAAKAMCEGVGARTFIVHRVVTIVSELARNIVQYTPGGTIELTVVRGKPMRFAVVATDTGTGVANLDRVMAGTYRSKTGMGRGLIGAKRLSDAFKIETGAKGTRIDLSVTL